MAIKLKKIKEERKNNKLTFLINGSDEAFTNGIRRLIIEEVPTLAVEDVEIKANNSALYDEMMALRLGLIPIKTDLKSYRLPKNEEEIIEKSARCTLQLKLKSSKKGYLYAEETQSADPKCTFVYPKMPITKILSKQKIDVTMTAVMGQGKEHIKWAPGWAHFKHQPVIKVGKIAKPQVLVDAGSDGVFQIKAGKLVVNEEKVYESKLLEYYAQVESQVSLTYSDNFIFILESWGQLTNKEILQSAAQILLDKVEECESLL
tara:strand:- start:77 stop:859 length:783 start_codon:yes stop_codon:yes gene_type:complete